MKCFCCTVLVLLVTLPCFAYEIIPLGMNSETGREEVRIILPGLPDGATPLDMVLIPAGTFTMGSPEDEAGRESGLDEWSRRYAEWLPHQVTITRDFYIGKYEITQAQWLAVMESLTVYEDVGQGDDYPAYGMWRSECLEFCRRLGADGNAEFRLPTEAEWEYACRAGTTTSYSYGDEPDERYMWVNEEDFPFRLYEVGLKLPNPWGLYDIHGNVGEFCSDWWEYPWQRGPQIDPQGPDDGYDRVVRGGSSWRATGPAFPCRSAARSWDAYYLEPILNTDVGIRVVAETLTPTAVSDWTLHE